MLPESKEWNRFWKELDGIASSWHIWYDLVPRLDKYKDLALKYSDLPGLKQNASFVYEIFYRLLTDAKLSGSLGWTEDKYPDDQEPEERVLAFIQKHGIRLGDAILHIAVEPRPSHLVPTEQGLFAASTFERPRGVHRLLYHVPTTIGFLPVACEAAQTGDKLEPLELAMAQRTGHSPEDVFCYGLPMQGATPTNYASPLTQVVIRSRMEGYREVRKYTEGGGRCELVMMLEPPSKKYPGGYANAPDPPDEGIPSDERIAACIGHLGPKFCVLTMAHHINYAPDQDAQTGPKRRRDLKGVSFANRRGDFPIKVDLHIGDGTDILEGIEILANYGFAKYANQPSKDSPVPGEAEVTRSHTESEPARAVPEHHLPALEKPELDPMLALDQLDQLEATDELAGCVIDTLPEKRSLLDMFIIDSSEPITEAESSIDSSEPITEAESSIDSSEPITDAESSIDSSEPITDAEFMDWFLAPCEDHPCEDGTEAHPYNLTSHDGELIDLTQTSSLRLARV